MYKLEFLPIARQDLIDIVRYISEDLENSMAANRLAEELIKAAESLTDFPYACPLYMPIRALNHEYRRLAVENYLILCWVEEKSKLITVTRVVYGKRDCGALSE